MNKNADEFLNLYKELEFIGRNTYFNNHKDYDNVMADLINSKQMEKYKEELNYCRVVRNFLTHNPKVNGEYSINPSDKMIELLKKLIKEIQSPPLAIDCAVPYEKMFHATMEDKVIKIMEKMDEQAITHVPIIQKGRLMGVFSDNVIYSFVKNEKNIKLNNETKLSYFNKYLPYHMHASECFMIVSETALLIETEKLFNEYYNKGKILAAVLITSNGKIDGTIKGMITPWNLLLKN